MPFSCFFFYLLVLVTVSEVVTYQVAFTLRLRLPLVQGTYLYMRSREVLAVDDRWTYEPFLIDKSALIHLIFGSLCMELGGIGQVQPRTIKQLRAGSYAFIYSFQFRFASGRNVLQVQAPNICGFLSRPTSTCIY